MDHPRKFNLSSLLGWVAAWSFFFASSRWALTSTMLGTPVDNGLFYLLGFPLWKLGATGGPFLCLGSLLAITGLLLWNLRVSMSALLFVGYGGISLFASIWFCFEPRGEEGDLWKCGSRVLVLMIAATLGCFLEHRLKELPRWHSWIGWLAIVATLGYYLNLVSIVVVSVA